MSQAVSQSSTTCYCRSCRSDCSVIYIDSFTILSFALSLQSLVGYFRRSVHSVPTPAIVNIHSYKMDPDFRISNEANYLFLISASTSGGLRRKLIEEKQADPKRVVHLLGVGPPSSALSESSVYYREWNPPSFPRPTADQQNTIIEIGTEEFLVSQGPPKTGLPLPGVTSILMVLVNSTSSTTRVHSSSMNLVQRKAVSTPLFQCHYRGGRL